MNADIYYEPSSAEDLVGQTPEIGVRVFVETDLLRHQLRVQRPTFHVRDIAAVAAELRNTFQFLRDGDLHMVTRYAFMIRQRLRLVDRLVLHVVQVDVVGARTFAVLRRIFVKRATRRLLPEWFHRLDDNRRLRFGNEQFVEVLPHGIDDAGSQQAVIFFSLPRVGKIELGIIPQVGKESADIVVAPFHLFHDLAHLVVNALHFPEARIEYLLRGHVRSRGLLKRITIELIPLRELPRAVVLFSPLLLFLQIGHESFIRRLHDFHQCTGSFTLQSGDLRTVDTFQR